MSLQRPVSRRAYCGEDRWRAYVEVAQGGERRQIEALIDLNPNDGTPNPRAQLADGLWVDVNREFVNDFRRLSAGLPLEAEQKKICEEELPEPRYPVIFMGLVEATGSYAFTGGREHPLWTGSFSPNDGFSPNATLALEFRPVKGLSAVIEGGVGPNFSVTQPVGLNHGGPADVYQAYVEYCRGIVCIDGGRRVTWLLIPVIRPDQRDHVFVGPKFSISEFTRTGASFGLIGKNVGARIAMSPGPDRVVDNNGFPYFYFNFAAASRRVSTFANWQFGPDQDKNTDQWKHVADLGVHFDPSEAVRLSLYGLFGAELLPTRWEFWGGPDVFLKVRPPNAPVGFHMMTGFTRLDPVRTGLASRTDVAEVGGGLTVFVKKFLQIRLQANSLVTTNGTRPFNGSAALPRIGLQLLFTHAANLGKPAPF